MPINKQLSDIDEQIESLLNDKEEISKIDERLKFIKKEEKLLLYELNQIESKYHQLVDHYESLKTFNLISFFSDLFEDKTKLGESLRADIEASKLVHLAKEKELKLMAYEKQVLLSKKSTRYFSESKLNLLINKKEDILKRYKLDEARHIIALSLELYSLNRKASLVNELFKEIKRIQKDIQFISYNYEKLFRINQSKKILSYLDKQEMKALARKVVFFKVHLEKFVNTSSKILISSDLIVLKNEAHYFIEHYTEKVVLDCISGNSQKIKLNVALELISNELLKLFDLLKNASMQIDETFNKKQALKTELIIDFD